jgi:hypothetical protein
MKVLNLCSNDYANMSHENAKALRSIGIDCLDAKLYRHNFKYKTESVSTTYQQIQQVVKHYDVIQIFHTDKEILRHVKMGKAKKIIAYHTGTRYRQQPDFFDKVFEGCTIVTDQCEFINNGNMHYLAPHVELSPLDKPKRGKLVLGHYPSNPYNKGTETIKQMLKSNHGDFEMRVDTKILSHELNLKRIGDCDIYVEMFNPEQDGKPYGCHGVTAFEASALGCKVITNNINLSAYTDVYGDSPFMIANTEKEFKSWIEKLKKKNVSLPNVYDKHNIKSTGKRILELIS